MGYAEKLMLPDERIVYRARLHWVIYLGGMATSVLAGILMISAFILTDPNVRAGLGFLVVLVLIAAGVQLVNAWIRAANTEIVVSTLRVIVKTGFISRKSIEMNLDKVESVLVDQSLLGRALDYGTLIVRGVGSGLEPVDTVASPLDLQKHLNAAS